jgi:hypothetical protein
MLIMVVRRLPPSRMVLAEAQAQALLAVLVPLLQLASG